MTEPETEADRQTETARSRWLDPDWRAEALAWIEDELAYHGLRITDLAAAVPTAVRVAIVGRALSWKRALAGIPPNDRGEWAGNVGGWLLDLFEPTPLQL